MPPEKWSGKRDLNPRLRPWQGRTLPLSYSRAASFEWTLLNFLQQICQYKRTKIQEDFFVFSQSFKNASSPLSVIGWDASFASTLNGIVAISAPINADSST